jgi:hypothetical protein
MPVAASRETRPIAYNSDPVPGCLFVTSVRVAGLRCCGLGLGFAGLVFTISTWEVYHRNMSTRAASSAAGKLEDAESLEWSGSGVRSLVFAQLTSFPIRRCAPDRL